jgi:hypothetical protein
MSLIVETGAVVAGAESYASVSDASAYHLARGNSTWGVLTTAQMEEALRRATDYMLQTYRALWKGYRKDASQSLDWPRSFVYLEPFVVGGVGEYPYLVADTVVPDEVERACIELAIRAAAGELSPDLERAEQSVRVGEIAVTYDKNSSESPRYRAVDAMLSPFLKGTAMNMKVERA